MPLLIRLEFTVNSGCLEWSMLCLREKPHVPQQVPSLRRCTSWAFREARVSLTSTRSVSICFCDGTEPIRRGLLHVLSQPALHGFQADVSAKYICQQL